MRPRDFDVAFGDRQGSVLGRVRRQLVQNHRNCLSYVRFQDQVRTVDPRTRLLTIGLKLPLYKAA